MEPTVNQSPPNTHINGHRVIANRDLSDTTYCLRFERNGMEFDPGQYLSVGLEGEIDRREYSIYSSPHDDFLEILLKEVDVGTVSKRLRRLSPGDKVSVEGPFGFFVIPEEFRSGRFLFVSTGTGISPFHCFAHAYPGLDYQLLHGVRTAKDFYEHQVFDKSRLVRCVTREDTGDFRGRVTDYLRQYPFGAADAPVATPAAGAPQVPHGMDADRGPGPYCYLCGNCDMIYEAFDILTDQGVPPERLFAEVYF